MKKVLMLIVSTLVLSGCEVSAQKHRQNVRDDSGDRISVGKVQRSIRVGMSSAEVVETLGSPNIVSTDDKRRESWVYDKISTETVHSTSAAGGGVSALVLGASTGVPVGGGLGFGGSGRKSAGAVATSQRTLTIIIKFDKFAKVRDIAYHASQF